MRAWTFPPVTVRFPPACTAETSRSDCSGFRLLLHETAFAGLASSLPRSSALSSARSHYLGVVFRSSVTFTCFQALVPESTFPSYSFGPQMVAFRSPFGLELPSSLPSLPALRGGSTPRYPLLLRFFHLPRTGCQTISPLRAFLRPSGSSLRSASSREACLPLRPIPLRSPASV